MRIHDVGGGRAGQIHHATADRRRGEVRVGDHDGVGVPHVVEVVQQSPGQQGVDSFEHRCSSVQAGMSPAAVSSSQNPSGMGDDMYAAFWRR